MSRCLHCKKWDAERDGACRLCRLCLAITQVAGQSGFTSVLAGILGNLTSKVLLVTSGGRTSPVSPATSRGGAERGDRVERERSQDRRRRSERDTRSPDLGRVDKSFAAQVKKEIPDPPAVELRDRRQDRTPSPREEPRERRRRRRRSSPEKVERVKSEEPRKEPPREKEEGAPVKKEEKRWVPQRTVHVKHRQGPSLKWY